MANTSGAIKAGRAFVELFVEDNAAYRALDKFGTKFKDWGAKLRNMGAALGAGGAGILAPLVGGLTEAVGRANSMQLLADRVGATVGSVSALAGGFERAGVSAEDFEKTIEGLETRIAEAADANEYLLDNLRSLGTAARLSALPLREQLYAIADAIERIPSAINKTRAARSLGLEGILPQLKKGRVGIDELYASGAADALTGDQGRQAVEVTKAIREAWAELKTTFREVGFALLPTAAGVAELKEQLRAGLANVREWVKENRGAVLTVAAVGAGLLTAGVAVTAFGLTVAVTGKLILLTLAGVKLAFGALLSPIGLATAAVVGLWYLIATETENGRQSTAFLAEGLTDLAGRAKEAFGGIADAVGSGDLGRAWSIGLAFLKAEWANLSLYLQMTWGETKGLFVDGWNDAVAAVRAMFVQLGATIRQSIIGAVQASLAATAAAMRAAAPGILGRKAAKPLDELAGALGRQKEAIGRQSDDEAARIFADRERTRGNDQVIRQGSYRTAYLDREQARKELAGLLAPRNLLGGLTGGVLAALAPLAGQEGGPARSFSGPSRLADAVKGTFGNAALSQSLAFGDTIPQQQLDAMRRIDTKAEALPQMARDLNIIAQGGRLGR